MIAFSIGVVSSDAHIYLRCGIHPGFIGACELLVVQHPLAQHQYRFAPNGTLKSHGGVDGYDAICQIYGIKYDREMADGQVETFYITYFGNLMDKVVIVDAALKSANACEG